MGQWIWREKKKVASASHFLLNISIQFYPVRIDFCCSVVFWFRSLSATVREIALSWQVHYICIFADVERTVGVKHNFSTGKHHLSLKVNQRYAAVSSKFKVMLSVVSISRKCLCSE